MRILRLRMIVVIVFLSTLTFMAAQPAETWIPTGPPNTVRWGHSMTLLQNGWVLMVGGTDDTGTRLSSAELYKPETEQWHSTNSMMGARYRHTATLLESGLVLVAGGFDANDFSLITAEIFDPATETWTPVNSLSTSRGGHSATLLLDGRVLIAGGRFDQGGPSSIVSGVDLFDPASQSFLIGVPMQTARIDHTATRLRDGRVLVAGGFGGGFLKSTEIFDPDTPSWTTTGDLNLGRQLHTAALLVDGRVLVAGGQDTASFFGTNTSEVYDPIAGRWDPTGHLKEGRYDHSAATLSDGRVLILSGNEANSPLASVEIYDPACGRWSYSQSLPHTNGYDSAVLLPDGRLLAAPGNTLNPSSVFMDFVQLVYPQLVLGGGFEVVLFVTNQGPGPWAGRAELNSGLWPPDRPWSLNGQDQTGENGFQILLEPGQTEKFVLTRSQGLSAGWLEIRTGHRIAHLSTSFFYNFISGNELVDSTGVAPAKGVSHLQFAVERSETINTGIAIQRSGEVLMRLFDEEGALLESQSVTEQGAQFFDEIFQGAPAQFVGSVTVESTRAIYLTVLRQEVISRDPLKFQLTSIPATELP